METHLESFFPRFFYELKAWLSRLFACDQGFKPFFSILFLRPQIGFFVPEVFILPINFLIELDSFQEVANFIEQEEIVNEVDGEKYEHWDGQSKIEAAYQDDDQCNIGDENRENPTKVCPPRILFP